MIAWLSEPSCRDTGLVGGKAAALGLLSNEHRVPAAFCITTRAFDDLPAAHSMATGLPSSWVEAVMGAYAELGRVCGVSEPRVAVRSSAMDEDSGHASFAGQHASFLNVGADGLVRAVLDCRMSCASNPAIRSYRARRGLPGDAGSVAVLVQLLIPADWSAVVFTADPVDPGLDDLLINATWGLGESLVQGTVTPDTYRVPRADGAPVASRIGSKDRMTVLSECGVRELPVPRALRARAVLRDMDLRELALLGLSLERRLGTPVDVECASHNDQIYLLQCRPITSQECKVPT